MNKEYRKHLSIPEAKHLSIPEAAQLTRVSEGWFRTRIKKKQIEHLRLGSRVFIPQHVIQNLLSDAIVKPEGEGATD